MKNAVPKRFEAINPRWVVATFKGRGIPTPTVNSTECALTAMSAEDAEVFRGKVIRAHGGTDAPGELEALAQWARGILSEQINHPLTRTPAKATRDLPAGPIAHAANDVANGTEASRPPVVRASNLRSWEPSHHIYGSKAALSIEVTEVITEQRAPNDRADSFWTLQMEIAPTMTKQRYDWDRKIIFRLTKRELPLLAAVLFGWTSNAVFANHGPANDKELTIEDQGSNLYIKLRQGKKSLSLPVGGEELFTLSSLVLKALGKNAPHLESQTILQIVKRAGPMYARSVGGVV